MSMNPFQMMMQMSGAAAPSGNPMAALMNMGNKGMPTAPAVNQNQPINPTQLKKAISTMQKEDYVGLVQQARSQGIKEEDIEAGLNFLLQLNKK